MQGELCRHLFNSVGVDMVNSQPVILAQFAAATDARLLEDQDVSVRAVWHEAPLARKEEGAGGAPLSRASQACNAGCSLRTGGGEHGEPW